MSKTEDATRHMLDTNVLVHIVNRRGNWRKTFKRIDLEKSNIYLSSVAYFELTNMILAARAGKEKSSELAELVGALRVEPFNRRAAESASNLLVHLDKIGKPIGQRDAMIAGHAKQLGCIVVTGNQSEFNRIYGLKTANWIGEED